MSPIDNARSMLKNCRDLEVCLKVLSSSKPARYIYVLAYRSLVANRELARIEDLSRDDKIYLWNKTKELNANLEQREMIELSQVLYVIEYFLNKMI